MGEELAPRGQGVHVWGRAHRSVDGDEIASEGIDHDEDDSFGWPRQIEREHE